MLTYEQVLAMVRDEKMPFDADAVAEFLASQQELVRVALETVDLEPDEIDCLAAKLAELKAGAKDSAELTAKIASLESELAAEKEMLTNQCVVMRDITGYRV